MLALFEPIKDTPAGHAIYDQVRELLAEEHAVQRHTERLYGMLLRLLLEAYASNPTLANVSRINAKLSELRRVLEAPAAPAATGAHETAPAAPPPPPREEVGLREVLNELLREPRARAPDPGAVTSPPPEAATEPEQGPLPDLAPAPGPAGAPEAMPPVERRVNSAYRLHLDRKRDEIAKLQEAFAQNVGEAIAQNREFGALLQIELNALQQAESAQEIETLRQILIGGIEELIQGHRSLELKLRRTSEYLGLIRSDSDRLRDELNKVRLLSLTDEYTGLPNRRAFMRRLQDELGRAQRYGSPLAVALLDLDEFKSVNDAHGHAAGDEVLRAYAANVLSILRHHDLVARYGGEEFAVLLPNTSLDGAVAALTKVRNQARTISCRFEGKELQVPTFSAGLTLYAPGDVDTTLVDRADRALYRAKRLGRNRIEVELSPATRSTESAERAPA
jgi:diguanylate cyclase (GGDEF)-like protein